MDHRTGLIDRHGGAQGWHTVPWAAVCYEGAPSSIADARRFTGDFLRRTRARPGVAVPADAVRTAQLVVSELVTNACKYAPGPCLLELEVSRGVLEITVRDASPALPVVGAAGGPERIGRHGLEIVLALSESFEARREPVGKRVLARLALRA
ncbi:ATP-binding protein [Streptomyces clavuligerus]|uniref:Putative regulatory protein n=1 Tax=Streptomyces clavuligerus TaxID=1901 RepID=E2QA93_STRCL|nr:ATP-binding protein [Streptomyces clavuligerus]ANW21810.1 regulator [Streptomyces clavuligerus]AXU16440.1 ATP-binding protein [Streptomyces clavuligerus]EFG09792.1 Putative regulatory protein [Streptomyces clavuligerus]MBY6302106.1 ATP-binding protein [Streptomyces clavuligerus]QCS09203.1 ATP-binding protein [Streptomyces clavuligerus]